MRIIKANDALEIYINQLLELEQAYNPKLRETAEEKFELYSKHGSIILLTLQNEIILGERSGLSVKEITEEDLIERIPHFSQHYKQNSLYVHSFTVRPEFRNKGIGKELAQAFINEAKFIGYKRIIGHAREGASKHINEIFGSRIIKSFENWYDTGENYYFHDLKI